MAHPCRRALVVDDDEGVREVLADSLQLEGMEVVSARGGAEALSALDAGCSPSVILLDLLMPGMSGERLLPILRRHPAAQGVPVVAMSASPDRLARIEGPDARLPKPFDLGVLLDLIDRLCAAREPGRLVLGLAGIDSEHRTQLELATAIAEQPGGGEALRATSLIDELIEGELMRRHAYPHSAVHFVEHARQVVELERWREASPSAPEARKVISSMEQHIATMDRDLARYLEARGVAA